MGGNIEDVVLTEIANDLNIQKNEISLDGTLSDLGASSIAMVKIFSSLNLRLDVDGDLNDLMDKTIKQIIEAYEKLVK